MQMSLGYRCDEAKKIVEMTDTRTGGLSAGEVARRLGVAVTTVRTWDRRYGLGPLRREEGRHRRYDEADMARLALMRRLTFDGMRAGEAARVVLAATEPTPDSEGAPEAPAVEGAAEARGLWQAAVALDGAEVQRLLRRAMEAGVVDAWVNVFNPALRYVSARQAGTGRYVESEHLLSVALSAVLAGVPRPAAHPRVLLVCAPDELHTLALEALAAALAEQGRASWLLGARVPALALHDAMARTGPAAVMVWAHAAETADVRFLEVACAARPRPILVLAGGPGWDGQPLPLSVVRPLDLPGALGLLTRLV